MKNFFLLSIALFLGMMSVSGQTVVYSDDFESYDAEVSLIDEGYLVWVGGAKVMDTTIAASGTKYALCLPSGNNYSLRKELTLEVGKTYTFEAMTKSPSGNNHKLTAILNAGTERKLNSDLLNHSDWSKLSVDFTVEAGEENVTVVVYSYPINHVYVDDFKVIEQIPTVGVEAKTFSSLSIQNNQDGLITLVGTTPFVNYSVFALSGQMIAHQNNINTEAFSVDLQNSPKGLYLIQATDASGVSYSEKVLR